MSTSKPLPKEYFPKPAEQEVREANKPVGRESNNNPLCKVAVKILSRDDFNLFKEVRLECLKNEAAAFRTKYSDEVDKPDSYWDQLLSKQDQIFFPTSAF